MVADVLTTNKRQAISYSRADSTVNMNHITLYICTALKYLNWAIFERGCKVDNPNFIGGSIFHNNGALWHHCPACRTSLIATRFWVVVICPIIKCLTVSEFSFILFDLCLFITIFNFILNYVPIVTIWVFTYHEIWILLIIFCFIWSYRIIYFLTCLEVFWSVVS